jgi:DNA repair protein RadC
VIKLGSNKRRIRCHTISIGSLSSPVAHERFKRAVLLENAAAVVFLHNHPSGDPAPSREDRECTKRLTAAAKILGIRVLDHVIFGETEYFSFADAGILGDSSLA